MKNATRLTKRTRTFAKLFAMVEGFAVLNFDEHATLSVWCSDGWSAVVAKGNGEIVAQAHRGKTRDEVVMAVYGKMFSFANGGK